MPAKKPHGTAMALRNQKEYFELDEEIGSEGASKLIAKSPTGLMLGIDPKMVEGWCYMNRLSHSGALDVRQIVTAKKAKVARLASDLLKPHGERVT